MPDRVHLFWIRSKQVQTGPAGVCPRHRCQPPCRILTDTETTLSAIETEIKFRVLDQPRLESQLASAGFRLVTPRSFESNVLYDTPDRDLRAKREIVRIRSYNGRWLLTHKRI